MSCAIHAFDLVFTITVFAFALVFDVVIDSIALPFRAVVGSSHSLLRSLLWLLQSLCILAIRLFRAVSPDGCRAVADAKTHIQSFIKHQARALSHDAACLLQR